jgi:regulation of enolase protein 1 (concanavalin A-like superfamily)
VAQDAHGQSATIQRELAVYGSQGFSPFDGPSLEPFWSRENLALRCNYTTGPLYSLTERQGSLILQVWNDRELSLAAASPRYPVIWRALPSSSDWAFLARLELRGQVFGDYVTGAMVEMAEADSSARYAFGIEDGTSLSVLHTTASGTKTVLQTVPWNVSQADLRIRRAGDTLFFEQRTSDVWTPIHSAAPSGECTAVKVGLFIATDTRQSVKVAFDDVILVDPEAGPEAK